MWFILSRDNTASKNQPVIVNNGWNSKVVSVVKTLALMYVAEVDSVILDVTIQTPDLMPCRGLLSSSPQDVYL